VPAALPPVAVVEDDPAMLIALSRLLRASGFTPVLYDGAEAFFATAPPQATVCLLLDIWLGGVSGIELQRRLRAEGSKLPVIVLTGTDLPSARSESTRLGCTAYLHKNVDAAVILGLIRQLAAVAPPD
jgi:FixJ family two-component response regulator